MNLVRRPFPLPVRVAAGLALAAAENARDLPRKLAGLPISAASQALQTSMRVQQHITALAIKGDDALSALRPVEETPEWATFDEDAPPNGPWQHSATRSPSAWDTVALDRVEDDDNLDAGDQQGEPADPWTEEERALAADLAAGTLAHAAEEEPAGPAAFPRYDELTLAQLRARLRTFGVDDLEELLDYESTHADRSEFTGMLRRRIATVRQAQ